MAMLLQTENLNKQYDHQQVLNSININILEGTIYGLVGPNGAGKSTLLKIISGIISSTKGKVIFYPNSSNINRKNQIPVIGSIIEEPSLYKNLTARENLLVLVKMFGLSTQRIEDVLQEVHLQDTGGKTVSKFSLGMKQRLGIACALLRNPKLLILDEPTNGLDPIATKELRELILKLPKKGITVIISSHNLDEIQKIVHNVGILNNGDLIYEGPLSNKESLEDFFLEILEKNEEDNYVKKLY